MNSTRQYRVEYFDGDQRRRTRDVELSTPLDGLSFNAQKTILANRLNVEILKRTDKVAKVIRFELVPPATEPEDHSDDICTCGDPDCSRIMGHAEEGGAR